MKNRNITVYPSNDQEISVIKAFFEALEIKFEITGDSLYDPEFLTKIENSRKQAAEGKTVKIGLDDIWK